MLERALRDEARATAAAHPQAAKPHLIYKAPAPAPSMVRAHAQPSRPAPSGDDGADAASEASVQVSPAQWEAGRRSELRELEEFRRMEQAALVASPFSSKYAARANTAASSVPAHAVPAPPHHAADDSLDGDFDDSRNGLDEAYPELALSASTHTAAVLDFDDHDAWDDGAEALPAPAPQQQHRLQPSSPPPRSQLVEKLFATQGTTRGQAAKLPAKPAIAEPAPEPELNELVRSKLQQLEDEIAKCKSEGAQLSKLKQAKETELRAFRREVQDFAKQKNEEQDSFNKFRDEEIKKLKRDRMLFETHVEATRNRPDKKQRDELEELRSEVARLQLELAAKEQKHAQAITRYKDRVQQLTDQVGDLENELRALEQARLTQWSDASVTSKPEPAAVVKRPAPHATASAAAPVPVRVERHQTKAMPPVEEPAPNPSADHEGAATSLDTSARSDSRSETIGPDGVKIILFKNGTQKEIHPNGYVAVRFFNGDVKETFANKQVAYYYAEAQTTHTTFPDGLEVIEFANGQLEKRHVDGTQEIVFPDQTVKLLYTSGEEETIFPDRTVQRVTVSGERVIEFPNGQREVHTSQFKKRRYPDGTCKIVYPDGRQETQYPNGRVRVKDKDGFVLVDMGASQPAH